MSRMLNALRQIEARRLPEPSRPEARRVDATTIEDALRRVEATLLAAVQPTDDFLVFDEPFLAAASAPESALVGAMTEIASIPAFDAMAAADDPAVELRVDRRTRALDRLAERILAGVSPKGAAAVMFGSPLSHEDTTRLLAELAPQIARRIDGDVLLLGANFEGPGLARLLGVSPERGLDDVLQGRCSWREAVQTSASHVEVLATQGKAGEVPAATRRSLHRLLGELGRQCRLVLVDGGSMRCERVALLGRDCDGTCLCLRAAETPARALRDAVGAVRRYRGRLLGTVLLDREPLRAA